jgi:hypothetical protein
VVEMECVGVPGGRLRRGWAGLVENGWRDRRDGGGMGFTSRGLSYSSGLRSGRWRGGGGLWGLTPAGLKTGHYTLNRFGARWRHGRVR